MSRTKFKDFSVHNSNANISNEINSWLEANPSIKIIKWSASPCGDYRTRLIIEFEELMRPIASNTHNDYAEDWEDYKYWSN